jgi:hypothetical protein
MSLEEGKRWRSIGQSPHGGLLSRWVLTTWWHKWILMLEQKQSRKEGIGNPLLSELREKLVFPVVGKGKWTEAFEPAWLGEERFKTGVLM